MNGIAFPADGLPVHFAVEGRGAPALVFVHGWSCDRTYWRDQIGHFSGRHQVVTIDLAGHGESGLGRRAWTMPAFGDDVRAVVEKLGLRDVVLIGHSMGGDVIVEAALGLPGRVAGLVWVDAYKTLGQPRTRSEREELLDPFRRDFAAATQDFVRQLFVPGSEPDLVDWVAADMSAAPPEVAVDALGYAVAHDEAVLGALDRLTAPVVAINPDSRPTDFEALARYGVKAVLMPGVGHFLMMEDPGSFNRLLGEAIAELRR